MQLSENVPLSSLTTFKVGGVARYVATCSSVEDIQTALAFAGERGLSWYVIGGGSNILASDEGYEGVLIRPVFNELRFEDMADGSCLAEAGAGIAWDALVQESVERNLWGLENLAGIPGLVGGAPVQNIGAYGADVSDMLSYVEVFNTQTNTIETLTKEACAFGYRTSVFKQSRIYIILRVGFILSREGTPRINYADLTRLVEQGDVLDTPGTIAHAVRTIRAEKFPDLRVSGTAGSFFKNPHISKEAYEALHEKYPALPGFPEGEFIKIPLAWILDHALSLRGYTKGFVRCFEKQPLVLVAEAGASTSDIESFAQEVEEKVFEVADIRIEREVQMLGTK